MRGIVFDLDGTLVDSLSVTIASFNAGFVSQGATALTPHEILALFGPGEGEIFSRALGAEKAPAAYEASRAYLETHMAEVPLHEGVEDLLRELIRAKVPISIFTGRSWPTTEQILTHHGILEEFVTVIAADHVSSSKPSPEGLLLAAKRMQIDPKELLFVGDSPLDIRAAHRAGSQGVAATWDLLAHKLQLDAERPHHWAQKPAEVFTLFRKLGGRGV